MLDSKLEIGHSHVGQFSHHPMGMICLITPVSLVIFFLLSFWLLTLQKKVKGTRPRTTVRDSEDILEQSKIYHLLGLSGTLLYAVFVYLYFYFCIFFVWHI